MEEIKELTDHYRLTPGASNACQRLPLPLLVTQMIDIATRHANMLGFGSEVMDPQELGWVLSRLTVQMDRWPRADSGYSITTWIESWNRRFSSRCFCVRDDEGNVLGYLRTIWMVIDVRTHRGVTTDRLNFRESLISANECPIPLQDRHITLEKLEQDTEHGELHRSRYVFRYTDIDFYRHVNTVRYIELLLNQYTLSDFDTHRIHRFEIAFMHEALYGQEAVIHRLRHAGEAPADDFVLTVEDTPVLRARMRLQVID